MFKGLRFSNSVDIQQTAKKTLDDVAKKGLQSAFTSLYERWQNGIVAQNNYFEENTT